jgi:RNA polymerase sigma-70 factor (ECF subfamily)
LCVVPRIDLESATEGNVTAEMVRRFRGELQVHCYRMLGSLADAEDATQEALLRAHRSTSGIDDPKATRAWLYKIATNVCLDRLSHQTAEPHLDPSPAPFWEHREQGPEARVSTRESIALAFLAALRELSPLQRAVLLLRDVMGWSAAEVAELLEQSVPAVNSALQRARARVPARSPAAPESADGETRALLARYVRAWEARDAFALASLLRDDATLTMPPTPTLVGRDAIRTLLAGVFANLGEIRVVAVPVSGGVGLAAYHRAPGDTSFRAHALQSVTLAGDGIAALHTYLDASLFPRFGLGEVLV